MFHQKSRIADEGVSAEILPPRLNYVSASRLIRRRLTSVCCLSMVGILLIHALSPCSSFQYSKLNSHQTISNSALWAKNKQQAGNKRKPRFAQQIHKTNPPQTQTPQQNQKPNPFQSPVEPSPTGISPDKTFTRRNGSSPPPSKKKKRGPPTTPTGEPYIPKHVPWNTGKSLDELENIMTKRWGTDASSWSEDPGDYEIVYDDDGDGDDFVNEEESFFFKPPSKQQQQQQQQHEYYDEDDDGFEMSSKRKNKNGLSFDHVISPKPVGGRGTNQGTTASNSALNDHGGEDDASPDEEDGNKSFYFRKSDGGDQNVLTGKGSQNAAKPEQLPFMKDEDGNPLLLTLEQAQANFDALVSDDLDLDLEEEEEDLYERESLLEGKSKNWEELGITSPVLLSNLQKMNCATPLVVQDKACPSVITGNDVLVGTYTGSGKTLAFLVPLIERLLISCQEDSPDKDQAVRVLVVVPGRELASQITSVARELLEGTGLTAMLAIGGTTFARNLKDLRARKPSIVVGTPGRIAELVVGRPGEKSGRMKTPNLQSLVLDEFDALLEYKPHRDPTAAIIAALKRRHGDALQSILCSATATDMLGSSKLSNYLRPGFAQAMTDEDDVLVTAAGDKDNVENKKGSKSVARVSRTVIHGVVHVPHRRFALDTLRRILHTEPIPQQILVFVENARKVNIVIEKLETMGIVAAPLAGGSKSDKMDRAEVAKALREGYVGIVVATELAARGLDAPLLTHVINLDLPTDTSHYAHRAGRCGRGGRPGVVINMTTNMKERNVPKKFTDRLGIPLYTVEARGGKLHIVEDP